MILLLLKYDNLICAKGGCFLFYFFNTKNVFYKTKSFFFCFLFIFTVQNLHTAYVSRTSQR